MKRALVTGGAGFIGSNLVDKLIEMDVQVMVVDNMRSGRESNFYHHVKSMDKRFSIVYKDIQALGLYDYFDIFKPDTVFHLAAIPGVSYSVDNVQITNDVNVSGTINLLELCKKFKVNRFIFSSSSSVYGGTEYLPTTEAATLNPRSPYALQKKIGEDYCKLYSKLYGLETVMLRYFNIFGPRQYADSPYAAVISSFMSAYLKGERPKIYGDGKQFRDFTYVDNVVQANILAATTDCELYGEEFNIGCGGRTSVNDLVKIIKNKEPIYMDKRAGDVNCSQADISKAIDVLGYEPSVSFNDGIKKTMEWYKQNVK